MMRWTYRCRARSDLVLELSLDHSSCANCPVTYALGGPPTACHRWRPTRLQACLRPGTFLNTAPSPIDLHDRSVSLYGSPVVCVAVGREHVLDIDGGADWPRVRAKCHRRKLLSRCRQDVDRRVEHGRIASAARIAIHLPCNPVALDSKPRREEGGNVHLLPSRHTFIKYYYDL